MLVLCDREGSDGLDTTCICVAVVRSMKLEIDLVGWSVPKKPLHVDTWHEDHVAFDIDQPDDSS